MTINPPTVGPFDEPCQCIRINHEWLTRVIGLVNYGDLGGFWSSNENDGQDGMRAILDVLALGNCEEPEVIYPKQDQKFATNILAYAGGPIAVDHGNDYTFQVRAYTYGPALNDEAGCEIYLEQGQAWIYVYHFKGPTLGIFQFSMNGTDFEDPVDFYSSSFQFHQVLTLDAVVPLQGRNLLKWRCIGKNASAVSPYYYWSFHAIAVVSRVGSGPGP
jgi:hypothetical protein